VVLEVVVLDSRAMVTMVIMITSVLDNQIPTPLAQVQLAPVPIILVAVEVAAAVVAMVHLVAKGQHQAWAVEEMAETLVDHKL
jgi:hypothetical protein